MIERKKTIILEFPSSIDQQEIWHIEELLRNVEGVETDLQEPKDIYATSWLILNITLSVVNSAALFSQNLKSIYDIGDILFNFIHKEKTNQIEEAAKRKVVIIKKNKRIEIYGLSLEELKKLLNN